MEVRSYMGKIFLAKVDSALTLTIFAQIITEQFDHQLRGPSS